MARPRLLRPEALIMYDTGMYNTVTSPTSISLNLLSIILSFFSFHITLFRLILFDVLGDKIFHVAWSLADSTPSLLCRLLITGPDSKY